MYRRITLTLNQSELESLREMANQEYRTTRDQAKYLLMKALGKENYNQLTPTNDKSATGKVYQAKTVSAFAGSNP